MRKLLALLAAVAMSAALAIPASADRATTFTFHPPPMTFTMTVPPTTCPDGSVIPGGVVTVNVDNSVFHLTINGAGDAWATGTSQGTFVFATTTGVTYTGPFATWFGDESNSQNFVLHSTFNAVGVGSDGSHISIHFEMHASISASGVVLVLDKVHC
jgi:hypothetical protein